MTEVTRDIVMGVTGLTHVRPGNCSKYLRDYSHLIHKRSIEVRGETVHLCEGSKDGCEGSARNTIGNVA